MWMLSGTAKVSSTRLSTGLAAAADANPASEGDERPS